MGRAWHGPCRRAQPSAGCAGGGTHSPPSGDLGASRVPLTVFTPPLRPTGRPCSGGMSGAPRSRGQVLALTRRDQVATLARHSHPFVISYASRSTRLTSCLLRSFPAWCSLGQSSRGLLCARLGSRCCWHRRMGCSCPQGGQTAQGELGFKAEPRQRYRRAVRNGPPRPDPSYRSIRGGFLEEATVEESPEKYRGRPRRRGQSCQDPRPDL